jgi:hypothetical protein
MKLDGNAIGGLLREVFVLDTTTAEATCAGYGAVNPLGRATCTCTHVAPWCAAQRASRYSCASSTAAAGAGWT